MSPTGPAAPLTWPLPPPPSLRRPLALLSRTPPILQLRAYPRPLLWHTRTPTTTVTPPHRQAPLPVHPRAHPGRLPAAAPASGRPNLHPPSFSFPDVSVGPLILTHSPAPATARTSRSLPRRNLASREPLPNLERNERPAYSPPPHRKYPSLSWWRGSSSYAPPPHLTLVPLFAAIPVRGAADTKEGGTRREGGGSDGGSRVGTAPGRAGHGLP